MKKHIILIISTLVISLNMIAQDAETVLRNTVDKLKSYNNIEFSIDYLMTNPEAGLFDQMTISGFTQGKAFKVKTYGQEIICDGTTTWTYFEDANEVNISDAEASDDGYLFSMIDQYSKNINARFIGNADGDIRQIAVTPSIDGYTAITFTLNVKTLELKEMSMVNDGDTEFVYKITKFATNQTLPDDFFTFKEADFPDAEIIDMR